MTTTVQKEALSMLTVFCQHTADWKQEPYNDEAVADLNAKMLFMAEHGSVCYGRA